MKSVRSAAVALSALIFVAAGAAGAPARAQDASPKALSPWDAQLYAAAFDAVKKGDFVSADQNAARVSDKSLLGFLEFQKLFHPTAYKATYAELMAWLDKYADLPGAQRVRALADKRKPVDPVLASASAPAPGQLAPPPGGRTWDSIDAVLNAVQNGERVDALTPKAAREALNAGDLTNARRLAVDVGDWWVAGLAAWRQRDYAEAFQRFEMIALDVTEDPWVRSGGAYWAARAAVAKGEPALAPQFLRIAAQFPHTFYGMIAERQLGLEPALQVGPRPYLPQPAVVKTAMGADLGSPAVQQLIRSNARAKRAVALAQLGQTADAGAELRAGMQAARAQAERDDWIALAMALNAQLSAGRTRDVVDPRDYPTPELVKDVPYTVDKALLYALMRRESRFEPTAISSVGAYGLMQVMPSTAAWLTGDSTLQKKPEQLHDPATNLRIGQAYIGYLAGQGPVANDILRVVAAYNGGPARVMETAKQLGPDADALTFIESIQVPQTRVYIEEVMAAYWTYRRIFGQDTKSLDAVAAGAKLVDLRLDTPTPAAASSAGQSVTTAALLAGQQ